MPKIIIAQEDDCFINVCRREGFHWETVWDHPENRPLREKRKHLNILKKGDRIYIPDFELKEVSAATEQRHTFVVRNARVKFTLTLLNLGQPRSNEEYTLKIDGFVYAKGTTDETGTLSEKIPAHTRRGLLLLGRNQEEINIDFGRLDPINEISGVQTRLQNLGFYAGEIDDELTPATVAAIAEFQRRAKLPGGGELNEETREKLVEVHGS